MFSMTMFAIIGCPCGKAAMKTGLITEVIADIFMVMALNTELPLAILVRCVMALVAVLLIFLVCLYHRARHQQRRERFGIDAS